MRRVALKAMLMQLEPIDRGSVVQITTLPAPMYRRGSSMKTVPTVLASSLIAVVLSGCAGAAIVPMLAGQMALTEGLTSVAEPEVEVSGNVLLDANWDTTFSDNTFSLSGNGDWNCARDETGQAVCIGAAEERPVAGAIYECTVGRGGMVQRTIEGNSSRMYCLRS